MNKIHQDLDEAIRDVTPGSSLAVGGFGLCGVPHGLIGALQRSGVTDLAVVSNNCGVDDGGLGLLLRAKQIRRVTASYIGENGEFARQYLAGELELELCPQGSLAERLRAGGAGIPAFYTATGAATMIADGGLPLRYHPDGSVALAAPPRESRAFGGRTYVLESAIRCDFALVRAARADRFGNCAFHAAARNFNPLCAMAGAVTIVEAEEIVPVGAIDPEGVHLPGVFVQRVVPVPAGADKPIERLCLSDEVASEAEGGR